MVQLKLEHFCVHANMTNLVGALVNSRVFGLPDSYTLEPLGSPYAARRTDSHISAPKHPFDDPPLVVGDLHEID